MKRATRLLAILLLLLAAPAAFAAGGWSPQCSYSGGTFTGVVGTPLGQGAQLVTGAATLPPSLPALPTIGDSNTLCYRYVVGDGAHLAGPFIVTAPNAQLIFDPQLDAAVTLASTITATLILHACVGGAYSTTVLPAAGNCPAMGGANGQASLTGVEGPDSLQNATKWIGPGIYYAELTACVAAHTCQFSIRGSR